MRPSRQNPRTPWTIAALGWSVASLVLLPVLLALVATACGDAMDPQEAEEEQSIRPADHPTPDPGPRHFPAPTGPYFAEDIGITLVHPDPKERVDLVLKDTVYWLPDDAAASVTSYGIDKLTFPLDGNEWMLGYKSGHIILNKYWELRHRILAVEVEDDQLIWHTRVADYGELIDGGHLYVDAKPDSQWPIGLDPIDVYLYPDRETQKEEIRERYVDSRLIRRQLEMMKHEPPAWLRPSSDLASHRLPLSCDSFPPIYPDDPDSSPPIINCLTGVTENIDTYRATADFTPASPNPETQAVCVDAGTAITCNPIDPYGDPLNILGCDRESSGVELCPCRFFTTDDQCAEYVCESLCGFEDDESGSSGGSDGEFGGSLSVCVNPDTHPEWDVSSSPHHWEKRCPGSFGPKVLRSENPSGGICPDCARFDLSSGPFNLGFAPIFTLTLGFKASLKFYFIGAKLRIGFYAGIGYGANAELEVEEVGVSPDPIEEEWFWSEEFGVPPPIQIPIFFLVLSFDPALRLKAHAEASVGGKIGYEYYDEHWFHLCFWADVGTGGVGAGLERGSDAVSKCDLPDYERDANVNGFYRDGDNHLEISAGMLVGLGVRVDVLIGGVAGGAGITVYPIELRANINISLRAPRCFGNYLFEFGGSMYGQIVLAKILGKTIAIDVGSESWTYDFLPQFHEEFLLTGEPWQTLFGCGEYPDSVPETTPSTDCPFGPDPEDLDGNCTEALGAEARCFLQECVEQEGVRISLGWQTLHDLELFVRSPSGTVYSPAGTPDSFSRKSCGLVCGMEPSNRFIENFTVPAEAGEWEAWVVLNSDVGEAATIPFSLEFETTGANATRQSVRGDILADEVNSPTSFILCSGEGC